jgi:hypothetical protein
MLTREPSAESLARNVAACFWALAEGRALEFRFTCAWAAGHAPCQEIAIAATTIMENFSSKCERFMFFIIGANEVKKVF